MSEKISSYFDNLKKARQEAFENFNTHFRIEIVLDSRDSFDLAIRFTNTHSDDLYLPIDLGNIMNFMSGKLSPHAPYKGLVITDDSNTRLETEFTRRISIGPTWYEFMAPQVLAHECVESVITGKIVDDYLVFPLCKYKLKPKTQYQLQFKCANVGSNTLNWHYATRESYP